MSFDYRCYDHTLRSDIALPMLSEQPASDSLDLRIEQDPVPDLLPNSQAIGLGLQVSAEAVLLTLHGIARYWLHSDTITVAASDTADVASVGHFLLSAAIPYWLLQHRHTLLKGAAFTQDGQTACLLLGESGAGKSTLLAALCQQSSAQMITDQWCLIHPNSQGQLCVRPGYAAIKLWQEATKTLQLEASALTQIRPNVERYHWPVPEYFCDQALPISRCIILKERNNASPPLFAKLSGLQKIEALQQFLLTPELLTALNMATPQAKMLFQLARQSSVHSLTRIHSKTSVAECIAHI